MEALLGILAVAFLVLAFVGVAKENKIRAKYSGVFGRIRAYFFAGGVVVLPAMIVVAIMGVLDDNIASTIGASLILAIIAVIIAVITKKNCPEYLQKGLFSSMLLAGLGIAMKIVLFFLPFIWGIGMPTEEEKHIPSFVRDKEGNTYPVERNVDGEPYIDIGKGKSSPLRRVDNDRFMDNDNTSYY